MLLAHMTLWISCTNNTAKREGTVFKDLMLLVAKHHSEAIPRPGRRLSLCKENGAGGGNYQTVVL